MKKKILSSVIALAAFQTEAVTTLTVPATFTSGTPISSSTMNSNFAAIQSFVNSSVCKSDGSTCPAFGTVTNVSAGMGLLGGPITSSGSLSVDVGTTSGKIVQLNGSAQLPAVDGSLLTNLNATNVATGTLSIIRGGTGGSTVATARANLGIVWDPNGSDIYFMTGNVGIGTNTPGFPLQVTSAANGTSVSLQSNTSGTGAGPAIDFRSNSGSNRIGRIISSSGPSVGGELQFQTSADGSTFTTPFVIKSDGKIGVGTIAPNNVLSVNTATTSSFTQFTNSLTGTTGADGLLIGNSSYDAIIKNQESAPIRFYINGTEQMQITPAGDVLNLSGNFTVLSDERLKKDFAPVDDIFGKLGELHAYYYKWKKNKNQRRQIGVKAQEVEKVFPELVSTGKDGTKSVAYSQLTAPLIEAVNSLKKENDQLKAYICAKDPAAPFCP